MVISVRVEIAGTVYMAVPDANDQKAFVGEKIFILLEVCGGWGTTSSLVLSYPPPPREREL
jgi:hypothetical protein